MPTKSTRLDIRMSEPLKERCRAAAEAREQTLTDWIVQAMVDQIERQERKLSAESYKARELEKAA